MQQPNGDHLHAASPTFPIQTPQRSMERTTSQLLFPAEHLEAICERHSINPRIYWKRTCTGSAIRNGRIGFCIQEGLRNPLVATYSGQAPQNPCG